jgi:GNAT superfamily N-acetyltransferase
MASPVWRPLSEDRPGALELLEIAESEARTAGHLVEVESITHHRQTILSGKAFGGTVRGPDGEIWGAALWTVLRGRGRRVSPIYVAKERANPEGWKQFLPFLLDSPDPSGPVLLLNTSLTGFPEPQAVPFLAARGFHPYHRFGLVFPPGAPVPPEAAAPLVGGRLRTLSEADLEPLTALSAACYAGTIDLFLFGDEADPLAASRSLLKLLFAGEFGAFVPEASIGLELEGKLRGATLVTRRPDYDLLADVEVHPSVQGQGYARRLIRATLEARDPNSKSPLVLAVTEENRVAFRLYRDLGFVVQEGPLTFWADTKTLGIPTPGEPGER